MPTFNMWSLMFRPWLAKRKRRSVPYADELLTRAAGKVNYGKIKRRR